MTSELGDAAAEFLRRARSTDKAREERDHMASVAMAVDRAQLLDGAATSHVKHSGSELREEVARLRSELAATDELAARRAQRTGS
jgi:hypothetical protein